MTSRPVAPALLAPLLGFALGALPSPGAPLDAQYRPVPGQVARFLDEDSLLLAVAADLDKAPFVVVETGLFAFSGPDDPVFARQFRYKVLQPVISERFAVAPRSVYIHAHSERGYHGRMRGRQVPPAPVVSWTETASGPVHGMALTLGIAELTDGNYDLKIAVAGPDGSVATAIRRFRVGGR